MARKLDKLSGFEASVYHKVIWRLIPFLFLCYVFAYLDRVNVGFAKLQMQQDLGMSDAVYGVGAGIFFIGYFLFEIPCNLMLQKIGAKRWLGPIMIIWGVVSGCGMFINSSQTFYLQRFVLGVVESGFFPGVILYLTFWFPRAYRARMIAAFLAAIPISGIIGGPYLRLDSESYVDRRRPPRLAMAAGGGSDSVHTGGSRGLGLS